MTKTKEKARMRNGVFSLFKYWKNITKPTHYNVVSLPGESFEFELKALELETEGEYMNLHMYEKLQKIHEKHDSFVKKSPYSTIRVNRGRKYIKRKIPNWRKYDEKYWLRLLLKTRLSELGALQGDENQRENIEKELLQDYQIYGLKSALGKLGKVSAQLASNKRVIKLDSYKPTKIGDYL